MGISPLTIVSSFDLVSFTDAWPFACTAGPVDCLLLAAPVSLLVLQPI
jgi:hypothetical protein